MELETEGTWLEKVSLSHELPVENLHWAGPPILVFGFSRAWDGSPWSWSEAA